MTRRTRIAALAVAALTTTSLAAAVQAPAKAKKTYSVNKMVIITKGVVGKPDYSGTVSGKPFGKGTVKGRITETQVQTLKVKGGTVSMALVGKIDGITIVGTWKFTKGTGKFKGIKGKGTMKGAAVGSGFSKLKFTFKGKARY